ncbi:hypothetical protein CSUI_005461 [Cystoisospora suis]|uniref:Uncharacterized protein n=1 Tax=Cystoisospora suis TaxID=483139 RepID=A0A2C6K5X1_9APIC|nr:hypothetical protein CSUI_005461 [Cystoisospora suis]
MSLNHDPGFSPWISPTGEGASPRGPSTVLPHRSSAPSGENATPMMFVSGSPAPRVISNCLVSGEARRSQVEHPIKDAGSSVVTPKVTKRKDSCLIQGVVGSAFSSLPRPADSDLKARDTRSDPMSLCFPGADPATLSSAGQEWLTFGSAPLDFSDPRHIFRPSRFLQHLASSMSSFTDDSCMEQMFSTKTVYAHKPKHITPSAENVESPESSRGRIPGDGALSKLPANEGSRRKIRRKKKTRKKEKSVKTAGKRVSRRKPEKSNRRLNPGEAEGEADEGLAHGSCEEPVSDNRCEDDITEDECTAGCGVSASNRITTGPVTTFPEKNAVSFFSTVQYTPEDSCCEGTLEAPVCQRPHPSPIPQSSPVVRESASAPVLLPSDPQSGGSSVSEVPKLLDSYQDCSLDGESSPRPRTSPHDGRPTSAPGTVAADSGAEESRRRIGPAIRWWSRQPGVCQRCLERITRHRERPHAAHGGTVPADPRSTEEYARAKEFELQLRMLHLRQNLMRDYRHSPSVREFRKKAAAGREAANKGERRRSTKKKAANSADAAGTQRRCTSLESSSTEKRKPRVTSATVPPAGELLPGSCGLQRTGSANSLSSSSSSSSTSAELQSCSRSSSARSDSSVTLAFDSRGRRSLFRASFYAGRVKGAFGLAAWCRLLYGQPKVPGAGRSSTEAAADNERANRMVAFLTSHLQEAVRHISSFKVLVKIVWFAVRARQQGMLSRFVDVTGITGLDVSKSGPKVKSMRSAEDRLVVIQRAIRKFFLDQEAATEAIEKKLSAHEKRIVKAILQAHPVECQRLTDLAVKDALIDSYSIASWLKRRWSLQAREHELTHREAAPTVYSARDERYEHLFSLSSFRPLRAMWECAEEKEPAIIKMFRLFSEPGQERSRKAVGPKYWEPLDLWQPVEGTDLLQTPQRLKAQKFN